MDCGGHLWGTELTCSNTCTRLGGCPHTPIFFVVRYSTFALSCGSDSIDLSRLQYIQSFFSSTLWCKSIYLFLGAYVGSMWYPKEEKDFVLNSIVLYLLHNQRVKVTRNIIKQINYASFLNLFIGHQN